MGRYCRSNARYNVISLRVNDEELEALTQESRLTRKSISELMREALYLVAPAPPDYTTDRGLGRVNGTSFD